MKESQLKNQELSEQVQELRAENCALSSRTSSGTTTQSSSSPSAEEKQIIYAGEKFCFAHELWLLRDTIQKPCPPGMDPNCPGRYENGDKVEEIAILTELQSSLSPPLYTTLVTPGLSRSFAETVSPFLFDLDIPLADLLYKFWAHYKSQRAQLVSKACQVASHIFSLGPTSAEHIQTADSLLRANDPELLALLRDPNKPGEVYPLLAPMLFPGKDCANIEGLFQSIPVMKVRYRIYSGSIHVSNLISVYQSHIVRECVNH
jgi:hypothetical protein